MPYNSEQQNILSLSKEYAEGTKRTVFFVGAGASAEVGMPTWYNLLRGLEKKISLYIDETGSIPDELEKFRNLEELCTDGSKFWDAFQYAADNWATTYNDYMEDVFDKSVPKTSTPVVYKKLWRMRRSRQIFTLNVDNLVARAFTEEFPNRSHAQILEYDGYSVTDSLNFISKNNYCVVNLHGTYLQKSRWIMSADQRAQLMSGSSGAKYTAYIQRLFSEYNVVFIGVNVADIAVSPFLQRAAETSVLGKHYWICPTPDAVTVTWAQKKGIRLITYDPAKSEKGESIHSQDICAILEQVDNYESKESIVNLPTDILPLSVDDIGSPAKIMVEINKDRTEATKKLSAVVVGLGSTYGFSSKELSTFLNDYRIPLQIASMLDAKTPGFNIVGSFKILNSIQSSGSSSVWTVSDSRNDNAPYGALKSLSADSLEKISTRQSFRRGIESIYLLSTSNSGVAPRYIYHSEVPLSLVMEMIPGETLENFLTAFPKPDDLSLLVMFRRICEAVKSCHQSEGHVLHRDIKPGNIMLENWHTGYELEDALTAKVRLINFDLSWHRFTSGDTKSISADDIGYYSQEQRSSANSSPPRTAETDVYMLGMVLYRMCSGGNPPDGGSGRTDWPEKVARSTRRAFPNLLVRNRVNRLIIEMTREDAEARPDLSNAIAEMEGCENWLLENYPSVDDDFVIENLAVSTGREYAWDQDTLSATIRSNESTEFRILLQHKGRRARIEFHRQKSMSDDRASFGARVLDKINQSAKALADGHWSIEQKNNRGMIAEAKVSDLRLQKEFGSSIFTSIADQLLASFD